MFTNKPFIVAELGAGHNGQIANAFYQIDAAKYAGADAVKFQTYTPDEIAADAIIETGPWAGRSYRDLYREGKTPWLWHESLFQYAKGQGLVAFSSPFSEKAVELLEGIKCPMYKIASPEITHLPLIEAAARTGKPLIISTGMASFAEIRAAYEVATDSGAQSVTFLHCISAYPAKEADYNLCTLNDMRQCGFKVGLSDHSLSPLIPAMAVTLGATVIEKHLCLDRSKGGIDSAFSLEPDEFAKMVDQCRAAYAALGNEPLYGCRDSEQTSQQYRRSLWVVRAVKRGDLLTKSDIAILRPNYGIEPKHLANAIGKEAIVDIPANTPLDWKLLK
jgi:pseudaminic acid synthase